MSAARWLGAAVAGACLSSGAVAAAPLAAARAYVMGTMAEVRIHAAPDPAVARRAVETVLAEFRTVERLMAVQRPESDVSRVNREAAERPVAVDARVLDVLEASVVAHRLTDGAFDPTVLPVVRAWGFTDGAPHVPGAPIPRVVGLGAIRLDRAAGTVTFADPGAAIDLGGIGKGWALDRARTLLRRAGVTSAYLDLGGNVATLGRAPSGGAWRIGIRHPRRPGLLLGVVTVGEAAVSTSSDAEQHLTVGARRVGHIVDPRTGEPVSRLASATVVSPSATMADALSTAAIVLGAARTRAVLARANAEGVLAEVEESASIVVTTTPGAAFVRSPE